MTRTANAMRRAASREQGREAAARIKLAEDELRLVVTHVGGLSLKAAGKLVAMTRTLQRLRLELEVEAERAKEDRRRVR